MDKKLNEKFFRSNYQNENERLKSKSGKTLFRDRSKSKVMAKILATTF